MVKLFDHWPERKKEENHIKKHACSIYVRYIIFLTLEFKLYAFVWSVGLGWGRSVWGVNVSLISTFSQPSVTANGYMPSDHKS